MLLEKNGGLVPTPLYVAFAAARHWITDSAYVGPVELGSETQAHLLLKDGLPMLFAWSDTGAQTPIDLAPEAQRVTPLGPAIHVSGPRTHNFTLGREPLMLWGVSGAYVREALHNRYRLYMDTAMGNEIDPGVWFGVSELKEDLANWTDEGYVQRLNNAVSDAAMAMTARPSGAAAEIESAMQICEEGMLQAAESSFENGGFSERARTVIWRLMDVNHWLGRIADNHSRRWSGFDCTPAEIADLHSRISSARDAIDSDAGRAAFSFKMLLRAKKELDLARQLRRRGAFTAARSLLRVVEYLVGREPRLLRRVFPVVDFTTATILQKAVLLAPGQDHEISVRVFNYLDRDVTGELELAVPATWDMTGPSRQQFTAPAGDFSDQILYTFTIPGGPRPWPQKTPNLPTAKVPVRIPDGLHTSANLQFRGTLSTGTPLMDIRYLIFVGEMSEEENPDTETASAQNMLEPLQGAGLSTPMALPSGG